LSVPRASQLIKFQFKTIEPLVDMCDELLDPIVNFLASNVFPRNLFTGSVQQNAQTSQFVKLALQHKTHYCHDRRQHNVPNHDFHELTLPPSACLAYAAVGIPGRFRVHLHLPSRTRAKRLSPLRARRTGTRLSNSGLELAARIGATICRHALFGHASTLFGRTEVAAFNRGSDTHAFANCSTASEGNAHAAAAH
jgi:hypothetical protein